MDNSDSGDGTRPPWDPAEHNIPRSSHYKTAYGLEHSVKEFIKKYGIERCAVTTVTCPTLVRDHAEASRRWNNAKRRLLSRLFPELITIKERHLNGGWHYHALCLCQHDIRTGFDWDNYRWAQDLWPDLQLQDVKPSLPAPPAERGTRRSFQPPASQKEQARNLMTTVADQASPHLLEILAELKAGLPAYGFGRFEVLPIRTNADAVAKYFSKQFRAMIGRREARDKNVRLVSYTKGARFATSRLAWVKGGREWRKGVALLDAYVGSLDYPCGSLDALSISLGPKWGFELAGTVNAFAEHDGVPPGLHAEFIRQRLERIDDGQETF